MPDGQALLSLGDLDDPESFHPNLERFGDGHRMSLFVPFEALATDPPRVLRFLEAQLGELLRRHPDGRGVFVFPEGRWSARTYDELIAEVAEQGFWATPAPPAPPEPEQRGHERAEQAMGGVLRPAQGSAAPEMRDVAERYEALAGELERAAQRLRQTAQHFRGGDVPRASAHRVAADGHLVKTRAALDALSVLHAEKSRS